MSVFFNLITTFLRQQQSDKQKSCLFDFIILHKHKSMYHVCIYYNTLILMVMFVVWVNTLLLECHRLFKQLCLSPLWNPVICQNCFLYLSHYHTQTHHIAQTIYLILVLLLWQQVTFMHHFVCSVWTQYSRYREVPTVIRTVPTLSMFNLAIIQFLWDQFTFLA